jgi:hypothetical protein
MTQSQFRHALLDPECALPPGLIDPQGRPSPKRFAVYRNNVAVSLTKALEQGFPVVQRLVGEPFFAAMAGVFLRQQPPKSPVLMFYGTEFPEFLASFPPVAHLGYLPDIARLELALRESYHAADALAVPVEALASLGADALMAARLRLAPSLRLVQSRWPIHGIWRVNTSGGKPPTALPEDVLVLRPEFDPMPLLLPKGGAAVIQGLLDGAPLGAALDRAPDVNPSDILTPLLQGNALVEILT